jgi:hypothetical protein
MELKNVNPNGENVAKSNLTPKIPSVFLTNFYNF